MTDIKSRLQRARTRLLRRVSGSPEHKVKSHDPVAPPQLRRSASLHKLPNLNPQTQRLSTTDNRSQTSRPPASPATGVENEGRHHSAETVVDSQSLLGPPQSLSSKDLRLVPLDSNPVTTPSATSNTSHEIAPALTLQKPSPPVHSSPAATLSSVMYSAHRKIWVKRPYASATLVQINRDDLVDDVRDMILRKYANSLGRSFDSPDVTLKIVAREHSQKQDRFLGPEEEICRIIDGFYPGGQTIDEALIIDVPQRRTPKPSPRVPHHLSYYDESARPHENGTEYFPPMPITTLIPSPAALTSASHESRQERSMTVIATGHVPPLPSPGGSSRKQHGGHRPRIGRHHTSSPTVMAANTLATSGARPRGIRHDSSNSDAIHAQPPPTTVPLPTPPAPVEPAIVKQASTPPVPRVSSPRPGKSRKRPKPKDSDTHSASSGLLDASVPPISVLIVEDNMINLRVLGAFMERLKVRWQRAMNGVEAVNQWRKGGFHLVLMDIQLPIMNGLEATKEIRRLERVNNIGVFSNASSEASFFGLEGESTELKDEDKLEDGLMFKSPVIIVALTASSLQSDRHEALAAGCNDFLTKPVNFVWLERKVKEWGCMQALIDFDGWRRWKDFAAQSDSIKKQDHKKPGPRGKKASGSGTTTSGSGGVLKKLIEDKKEEDAAASMKKDASEVGIAS